MKTLALCLCLISTWATAAGSAEDVFGRWERIDISEIYKPIPDSRMRTDALGAVTNEYKNRHYLEDRAAKPNEPTSSPVASVLNSKRD